MTAPAPGAAPATQPALAPQVAAQLRPWAAFAALALFYAACTVAQSWRLFVHPPLYYEDAWFFAHFYNNPSVREVAWFYNGYVSLLPNAVVYVTTHLFPTRWAPYLLSLWALGVGAVACSLFALPRFRAIVPSDRARVAICALLTLWPLGDFALASAGVYSLWHMLLALGLLALAPAGRSRRGEIALAVVQILFIWSHPLSIALVPLWLVKVAAGRDREERIIAAALVAAAVAYQLFGVHHAALELSLRNALRRSGWLVWVRVVFESVVGARLTVAQAAHGRPIVASLGGMATVATLAALLVAARRRFDHRRLLVLAGLAYLIYALTVGSVWARNLPAETWEWGQRHYYVQQYLFLLAAMVVLHGVASRWRWSLRRLAVALTPVAAFAVFSIYSNRYAFWEQVPGDGPQIAAFLEKVAAAERDKGPRPRTLHYERPRRAFDIIVR
jgi:hypothetical protein